MIVLVKSYNKIQMNCYDIQYEITQYLHPSHYSCISKSWYNIALQHNTILFPHLYYSGNYNRLAQWIIKNNITADEIIRHIIRGRITSSELIVELGRIFKPEPIYHDHFVNAIKNKNVILAKFIKDCIKWTNSNKLDYMELIVNIDVDFLNKVSITHYDLLSLVDYYDIILWYSCSYKELKPLIVELGKIKYMRHEYRSIVERERWYNSYDDD